MKWLVPWTQWPFALILVLLCFLLYYPALNHGFVFDDKSLVVENPYIKSWKYLPQMLSKDVGHVGVPANYWRPVFLVSLALDYFLWGATSVGFHLTNILLHAVNSALLYFLVKRLLGTQAAAFASFLFAVHPIQAHTVNIISTRGDLLAAFFGLLSIHAFLSRSMTPFSIALVLALLSKETSMVFPIPFSFWLIVQGDKRYLPAILAFLILSIYLVVRISLGFSFSLAELVFSYDALWDVRLLLACKVLALYFVALFNLFEIPHPVWTVQIPTSASDLHVISGLLIFVLLLGVIWANLKKNPLLSLGLIWFIVFFLPVSNIIQLNQPMAEHWLYLPMTGLGLAFGAALNAGAWRVPKVHLFRTGVLAAISAFLIFAVLVAREKTRIYQDDESFLMAAIRANPQIVRLYTLMGNAYAEKQDIPKAIEFYTRGLALDASDFQTNYLLGSLLYQIGEAVKAKIYLERISETTPVSDLEFAVVAHAWEMLGEKEKALLFYRAALRLNPQQSRVKQKIASLEAR